VAERPGILRIGDRVVFSGAEYSVVALSGSLVRLVADSRDTAVVAMAYLAGAPDFAVVGAGPRARVSPAPPANGSGTWPRWRPAFPRARSRARPRSRSSTRWPAR
jgi:hypothetical protein